MQSTVSPKKALGQNFLTDSSIVQTMVAALDIQTNDQIIEIGGGAGAVTQYLAPICISKKAYLKVIEFDIDLIPILKSKIQQNENVEIVNANILNFLDDFTMPENTSLKIIGSLPYNITSPLIHRLVKNSPMPITCVFLIQKEVAQKIEMYPPDSSYLSVFVQTFYEIKLVKIVDKNLFEPVPKVDGALISLKRKDFDGAGFDISHYEKFLHHTFSQPRKMLNKVFTKVELEKYQLDGTKRAQNYGADKYLEIFLRK